VFDEGKKGVLSEMDRAPVCIAMQPAALVANVFDCLQKCNQKGSISDALGAALTKN